MVGCTDIDLKFLIDKSLLEKFEERGFTYVLCSYTARQELDMQRWVNISKTTFLENADNNNQLRLLNALNIPYATEKHFFKSINDTLKFILIFPAIPKDWKFFHLIEVCHEGIEIYHYKIPRNETGFYKIKIEYS